jgi:DNA primase
MSAHPADNRSAGADSPRLLAAHRAAQGLYRHHLITSDGPRRYLTDRGLGVLTRSDLPWSPGVDAPWHLGYAPPGWTTLVEHLTRLGFTPDELVAAGLATAARRGDVVDTFRDRIIFPIHNPVGDPIAFIGRAAPAARPDTPKYLNTPDTAIYHKGQTLYGLGEQRDRIAGEWAPVIVEGPIDVLAVWLAHPDSIGLGRIALAPCGTSLTSHHATTMAALPGSARHGITTAFDNDPAGRAATERVWRILPINTEIDLRAATLPDGADPGDLISTPDNAARLRASLSHQARPLVEAVIDIRLDRLTARHPFLLDHVEGRIGAARTLATLLTDLPPEQIVRLSSYIAARIGAGIDIVADAVIDNLEAPRPATPPTPAPPTATDRAPPAPTSASQAADADTAATMPPRRGRAFPLPGTRSGATPSASSHSVPGVTSRRRRPR